MSSLSLAVCSKIHGHQKKCFNKQRFVAGAREFGHGARADESLDGLKLGARNPHE